MLEFTKEELLVITDWAMAKADSAIRRRTTPDMSKYEVAESIFHKAHTRYCEMLEAESS